jgi:hypothetical protein
MIAKVTDPAAATTVEDNPPETRATQRLPITYRETAKELAVKSEHYSSSHRGAGANHGRRRGRPFIVAMVINKWRSGLQALGFFDCAARLGRFVSDTTGPNACTSGPRGNKHER